MRGLSSFEARKGSHLRMTGILLRRPRIDRRGAADAEDILEHPGAGEQLRLAAGRRHHLEADRQA